MHTSNSGSHDEVLLPTCKVKVIGPDGSTHQARALLDSASSVSFITKRLAQQLHLQRSLKVSGIGGGAVQSNHGTANFRVLSAYCGGRSLLVEAIALLKVTSDMPSRSVPFNEKWKHLVSLPTS